MGEPMQADGKGTSGGDKLAEAGREGGGESGGGAYADKKPVQAKGGEGGFMGHGGQSETTYHGGSDDDAAADNPNAGAEGA